MATNNSNDSKKNKNNKQADRESFSEGENETAGSGRFFGEAFKKVIASGLGAAFMTEEGIRNYLNDIRLPKDVLNHLVQGASKSKEELMNRVGNEVIKIISRIDFVKEASRFVEEHKFRIQAEVEVIRKDNGKGQMDGRIEVRMRDEDEEPS